MGAHGLQALRCLRAAKPVAELPTRWIGIVTERGTQKLLNIPPVPAPHDFRLTRCRSLRILRWALLVVVMVIPVVDPFPDIARHIIKAIGTLAQFEHPHRD